MLDPSTLRHRLEFQRLSTYLDTAGDTIEAWSTAFKVWGAVDPLSAREFIASQSVQSAASVRVTIRYRPDVTPDMRILHRGHVLNIEGDLPDKVSGLEYLTLPCSRGVNQG